MSVHCISGLSVLCISGTSVHCISGLSVHCISGMSVHCISGTSPSTTKHSTRRPHSIIWRQLQLFLRSYFRTLMTYRAINWWNASNSSHHVINSPNTVSFIIPAMTSSSPPKQVLFCVILMTSSLDYHGNMAISDEFFFGRHLGGEKLESLPFSGLFSL
jgi:hypothetical protein